MTRAAEASVDAVLAALTDPDRLTALDDTGLVTHGGDPTLDRVARLASTLVDAPRAFVSLITPDHQHLAGMVRHDDPANTSRELPLSASLCQFAVATEEPLDKAGAYHVDGRGALFITRVAGAPSNVAGLPVRTVLALAREAEVDLGFGGRG